MKAILAEDVITESGKKLYAGDVVSVVADMEDDFYWVCLGDGQIYDIYRNNLLVLKDSFLKDNM